MSMPTTAPVGKDIQELLDRAEKLLERIRNKMNELVDTINRTLSSLPDLLVPDFVVDALQAGIRKMNELFTKLVTKMAQFFQSPGWPPALFDAGELWLSGVAGPSAATEEQISTGGMKVDDYWKGEAAKNYQATLGKQQPAFAAMVTLARKIETLLNDAAWGIIKFWIAAILALVVLVGGIFTAIGLALGGVTLPGSVPAAIGAIIGALAAIGGGAWVAISEFQGVTEVASSLKEERQYNTSFDGDNWPAATAKGAWRAD